MTPGFQNPQHRSSSEAPLGQLLHAPSSDDEKFPARIAKCRKATFILLLGSTRVSDLPGFSAAGADPQAIRHTPAIDARALVGALRQDESLPVSPLPRGVTSPVVLTRAALSFINHRKVVIDCGTFHQAEIGEEVLASGPADSPETGAAQSLERVESLYRAGLNLARKMQDDELVVLAECVPGGTTTALGLLLALDFAAQKLVSGSHVRPDHNLKANLIGQGLKAAANRLNVSETQLKEQICKEPLKAVSLTGDGMQAFAGGFCSERDRMGGLTVLAGGSQMLAVYALAQALMINDRDGGENRPKLLAHSLVATTKWVADDPGADTRALARLIGAPFAACFTDFTKSQHAGLRAYEEGNVKEGVGAGAAMLLAHLMGQVDEQTLLTVIDSYYEALTRL